MVLSVVPTTTTTTTNLIGDLAGIQQEYSPGKYKNFDEYVNAYNSTNDKTKLIILETHQVNNNDDTYNDTNPSMIPNDGEKVVLPSSVSRMVKNNNEEKNDEVSSISRMVMNSNEVKNVHQYGTNYDDEYVEITSATDLECLELYMKRYTVDNINTADIRWYTVDNNNTVETKLEWILKKYRVDNDSIDDTELEWIRKKYRVDNDFIKLVIQMVIQAVLVISQLIFRSVCQAVGMMLKMQERIEATQIDTLATISSPGPKPSLKKQTHASESTTSPRKKVSSNQDPLKRAHPTECCFIMKRKDGECPDPEVKLYYRAGCSVMKRKDGECPNPKVKLYYRGAY